MLAKFFDFVKKYRNDIILSIIIFLLVLLAFGFGYLFAKYIENEPIQFIDKTL